MNSHNRSTMSLRKKRITRRWLPILGLISVLIVACTCSDILPLPATPPPSGPPTNTLPPGGEPPTVTTDPGPPPTPAVWDEISGMWSGCPPTADADVFAEPCSHEPGGYPLGNFLTMYLLPSCSVGEMCGSYVKGRFDSEFILYHLTLLDIVGDTAYFFGDPGEGMFEGMEMDVEISRVGPNLYVADTFGESYIIPPGCDPIIDSAFRCWDTVP